MTSRAPPHLMPANATFRSVSTAGPMFLPQAAEVGQAGRPSLPVSTGLCSGRIARRILLGLVSCLALLLPAATARASISLTGPAVVSARNSTGTLNVANGSLGLLIVDVAGNGFLGMNNGGSPFLSSSDDPRIPSAAAGLRVGTPFGGDVVLARLTASSGGAFTVSLPALNILPSYLGKSFAIVWFDQIQNTTAPTLAPAGSTYGIVHGSDWVLPASDGNSYLFLPADPNGPFSYYQVDLAAAPISPENFRTTHGSGATAASFTVVPEPSSPLLASAASLLLFRRRLPNQPN